MEKAFPYAYRAILLFYFDTISLPFICSHNIKFTVLIIKNKNKQNNMYDDKY